MVHLFNTNMLLSVHKMLIDGLEWCEFLVYYWDVFYLLFGLSFWRHPFTAEDPLVSKWCNARILKICSNENNYLSTCMAWG